MEPHEELQAKGSEEGRTIDSRKDMDLERLAAALLGASYFATHHRLYSDDNEEEKTIELEWLRLVNVLCREAEEKGITTEWLLQQGRTLAVAEYQIDHPE